ncbi:MAG: copper-binding protein [Comamonas sp.]
MNKTIYTLITALGLALAAPAMAQDHSNHSHNGSAPTAATSSGAEAVLTAGEITRVDARSGKLTIRHEEIKNLDMPPMTMVFALAESAKPAEFKAGDKVLFRAEEKEGTLIITRIQPAS